MSQETVFPQIQAMQPKVNSPELLAIFQAYGIEKYADADFFNLLRAGMLELYDLFQLAGGRRITKVITDVAYTVIADDYNKQLFFTSNAAVTVTVPQGLDLNIVAFQEGNGQVTFVGDGVILTPPVDCYPRTETKGSVAALIRRDVNNFKIIGKLDFIV